MNDIENNEHDMDWLADQLMRLFAADDKRLDAPEGMCRESRRAWRLLLFLRQVISEDVVVIPRDLDRYLNLVNVRNFVKRLHSRPITRRQT